MTRKEKIEYDKKIFLKQKKIEWKSKRWNNVIRPYSPEDVWKLKGTQNISYTLAENGCAKLWYFFNEMSYVHVLSAVTGNQAIQLIKARLKAIYVSGWQVAADANKANAMYPDQSLYPADSVPYHVNRINKALLRADEISHTNNEHDIDWLAPIVADAEAGFGGVLNAFELMKAMIENGAAGVHFEDQLSSAKKCGHMGGKVLVPTKEAVNKLISARLAADILGVDTILIARTDANAATLITSDIDSNDTKFIASKKRTEEGFFQVNAGLDQAISRGLAYAPYADLLWCETSKPDLGEAKEFAQEIHRKFPEKFLAYNCSPSFNWKKNLDESTIEQFQIKLGEMGYKFQFVTLSGFHVLNHSIFELALDYKERGMAAYSKYNVENLILKKMATKPRNTKLSWVQDILMSLIK